MAERVVALLLARERGIAALATLLGLGLLRALAVPPARGVDLVLWLGWGHLLGALLGDARRLRRAGLGSAPALDAGLAVAAFAAALCLASPWLEHPGFQLLLLLTAFAHIFENEAQAAATRGVGLAARVPSCAAGRLASACAVAAPCGALAVLVWAALAPDEWAALSRAGLPVGRAPGALEVGVPALVAMGVVGLAGVACAGQETRGRGLVALAGLAVAATPAGRLLSAAEWLAAVSAYHYARFALRACGTAAGRRRVMAAHAAPLGLIALVALVVQVDRLASAPLDPLAAGLASAPLDPLAAGLASAPLDPLAAVSAAVSQPGLFLLGSALHALHTGATRRLVARTERSARGARFAAVAP